VRPAALDRVKTYLARIVDDVMRRVDWYAWYPARVLGQSEDGTLELRPDNPRVPGLSKVPLRLGVPGVRVNVLPGARVLVGFEGGDPSRPVASLWERQSCVEIALDPSSALLLGDGATQDAVHGTYFVSQLQTLLTALQTLQVAVGSFATTTGTALSVVAPSVGGAAVTLNAAITTFSAALTAFNTAGSAPPGYLSTLVKVK